MPQSWFSDWYLPFAADSGPGYKPANKGPKDLKPPDLWIDQMEMKGIEKNNPETTASVSPLPRGDMQDAKSLEDEGMMDTRRNSFISKCGALGLLYSSLLLPQY